MSNVSSVHSSPRPNLPLPQHTWKALRMRKTRSYASLGLKRLRASCTTSLSSGIRSSTLQAANHQRGVPLKACLVVREGMRCPWCLPQSQFAISGAVHVPVRQRLHPPPQPGTLDDEGGERRLRHLDGSGGDDVAEQWGLFQYLDGRRSSVGAQDYALLCNGGNTRELEFAASVTPHVRASLHHRCPPFLGALEGREIVSLHCLPFNLHLRMSTSPTPPRPFLAIVVDG